MFQVGNYLNPSAGDPCFDDLADARKHAESLASQRRLTAIAIWGEHNETLYLFLNEEEFQCI